MDPQTTVLEEINYFKSLFEWRAESKRSSPPRIAYPFTIRQRCKPLGPQTYEEICIRSLTPRWEVMVASLLYYKGRIAKWCTVLGASDTMCMPRTLVKGQILANLVASPTGPPLEEGAATQSDSRGLRGETSSGRYILISPNLLKRLNGALAVKGPRTSYFRGIITHCQLFKC